MGAFRFQLRMLSAALLAATALGASNHVQAQTLPPGSLLQVSGGNTPGAFQDYTFTYTPTQTGNNYLLFAFRNDPGYWTFGNVTVSAAGSATNLLSNPALATGGATQGVNLPTSWGYATQTGVVPNAGGTWMPPGSAVPSSGSGLGVNTSTAGSWYDGAVGSFDALYQGLFLNSGVTYTVSFSAEFGWRRRRSNHRAWSLCRSMRFPDRFGRKLQPRKLRICDRHTAGCAYPHRHHTAILSRKRAQL